MMYIYMVLFDYIVFENSHDISVSFPKLAAERRRREEGWNDLGLDQLDNQQGHHWATASANWNSNPPNAGGGADAGGNNN